MTPTAIRILAAAFLTAAVFIPVRAQESAKFSELDRKLDVLSQEIERLKLGSAAPPDLKSIGGFGPGASKVYQQDARRVSVGGYGEMVYASYDKRKQNAAVSSKKDTVDFLRAILYFGYKFNDWITFNSEFEFEHANEGKNGEVGVEMAQIDLKPWGDYLGLRTGLMLMPMGLTNEMHEPPTFHGVNRPNVEQKIIPTTWRETGAGVFGDIGPVTYRSYIVTGLQGAANGSNKAVSGFSGSDLRGGRASGSKGLANSWAWVGRVDYEPMEGSMIGASAYHGGVDHKIATSTVHLALWDIHARVAWEGLEAKALYAVGDIDNAAALNQAQILAGNNRAGNKSIGSNLFGGYIEVAYDVLHLCPDNNGHQLLPFFRYERFDTQNRVPNGSRVDPANSRLEYTAGVSYRPMSQVVLKFDHQWLGNQAHTGLGQTNFGFGYLF